MENQIEVGGQTVDENVLLTPNEIIDSVELEYLEMPMWKKNGKPGGVLVRYMTAEELMSFTELEKEARAEAVIRVVARSLSTKTGEPLLAPEQVEKFKQTSLPAYRRLQDKVMEMNDLTGDDDAAAKQAEKERVSMVEAMREAGVEDGQIAAAVIAWSDARKAAATEGNE